MLRQLSRRLVAGAAVLTLASAADWPAPPGRAGHDRLLVIPFVGLHSFRGPAASDMRSGPRMGAVVGYRVSPFWSLNGELAVDLMNLSDAAFDTRSYMTDLALAPLMHVPYGGGEMVFGPIVGRWSMHLHDPGSFIFGPDFSAWGWTLGVNAGQFFRVYRDVRLGGLFSFVVRDLRGFCVGGPGRSLDCGTVSDLDGGDEGQTAKVLSFTLAAQL